MAQFIIEAPHTNQGCLEALDEVLASNPKLLSKFNWGCNQGYHTGWAVVGAENETEVREMMPVSLRSQARIFSVDKFTPEQIRSLH